MELDLNRDFNRAFIERWELFAVSTRAASKADYLLHPERGRCLSGMAREEVARRCPTSADLQIVIGDGLSVAAVIAQAPLVLDALMREAESLGWRCGQPFVIHHCRVGVLNDIGELLDPTVVVLLIGERPGLATAESLSAYLAYRPRAGHTDAERNLISNIHARGVAPTAAAARVIRLAMHLRQLQLSGVAVKETTTEQAALFTSRTNT
jgi:ethanolamine ammonia-lyase small subunit